MAKTEPALALAELRECEYDSIQLNGHSFSQRDLSRLNRIGLVLPFPVAKNFILESYRDETFAKKGFLRYRIIKEHSQQLMQKFRIRVASVDEEIAHLSSGNQQKVVVARELDRKPSFLLVNQPTRGIDIGATEFVRQQILAQRDAGTAVLLISTDLRRSSRSVTADHRLIEQVGLMMAGKRVEQTQT